MTALARPPVGRAPSMLLTCAGLWLTVTGVLAIRPRLQESWTDPVDALQPLAILFLLAGAGWLVRTWPPRHEAGSAVNQNESGDVITALRWP